jgi:SAM-dependent methyltransferase
VTTAASLVYRDPLVYEIVMIALYGRHYAARSRAIADLIPAGASVLDVCCGPGLLYERHLRRKPVDYTGIDVNPRFVDRVNRLGGRGRIADLRDDAPLPRADHVVMQSSLYHFLPDAAPVVERLFQAAREQVILSEPVRNLASGRVPVLSRLARRHTDAGLGAVPGRFDEAMLDTLVASLSIRPRHAFLIPGGREKIYVFDVRGA